MKTSKSSDIVITGLGVTASIGQGKSEFTSALLHGQHNFSIMQRPGRQYPSIAKKCDDVEYGEEIVCSRFLGAEIPSFSVPDTFPHSILRTASLSGQVALSTLLEAWNDANLSEVEPTRIGLIIGGSNFQQREQIKTHDTYKDRLQFLRPTYGLAFMDSDLCGMCTEVFDIQGFAYTLGGASASGQMAVLHAIQSVESGQVDICIAIGALMDLSYWECQGFRALGAMGSDTFADEPECASRPFDKDRDGFIFGESCGAVVVEKIKTAKRKGVNPYARIAGWAVKMDGNRNPNPSCEGEINVIQQALHKADINAEDIDYINPHGTGSILGDETELKAISHCGLNHAYLNSTKSIIGHGLSAAGAVEIIATLLQMRTKQLHPSRNLDHPIDGSFNWARVDSISHTINYALKMSMGFGGINTALCMQRI